MVTPVQALQSQFTAAELQAMFIAGEIGRTGVPILDLFVPLGTTTTITDRAASLRPLMLPGRTIVGAAAAWVWSGGAPPPNVEIMRNTSRLPSTAHLVFLRGTLHPTDIVDIAGCRLTTPQATLQFLHAHGELHFSRRLQQSGLLDAERVIDPINLSDGRQHTIKVGGVAHLE